MHNSTPPTISKRTLVFFLFEPILLPWSIKKNTSSDRQLLHCSQRISTHDQTEWLKPTSMLSSYYGECPLLRKGHCSPTSVHFFLSVLLSFFALQLNYLTLPFTTVPFMSPSTLMSRQHCHPLHHCPLLCPPLLRWKKKWIALLAKERKWLPDSFFLLYCVLTICVTVCVQYAAFVFHIPPDLLALFCSHSSWYLPQLKKKDILYL